MGTRTQRMLGRPGVDPPPPPTARRVEEDNQPSATEQGGDHRPVGQANKALEGEVNPHLSKAYHISGVVQDV